jgi:hypothetical protein
MAGRASSGTTGLNLAADSESAATARTMAELTWLRESGASVAELSTAADPGVTAAETLVRGSGPRKVRGMGVVRDPWLA